MRPTLEGINCCDGDFKPHRLILGRLLGEDRGPWLSLKVRVYLRHGYQISSDEAWRVRRADAYGPTLQA